ncbi:hypothetical protein EOC99_00195 [Mesorhizobium sp. M7A.T.Ca.TU.009.01.1.1]|nr:hypothetical protein EOC99_00195 [Mesorhizobium sp. M7A.T.Ca.TU.009.01.1.1]
MPRVIRGISPLSQKTPRASENSKEPVHAGLVIVVWQVVPDKQKELLDSLLGHHLGPEPEKSLIGGR